MKSNPLSTQEKKRLRRKENKVECEMNRRINEKKAKDINREEKENDSNLTSKEQLNQCSLSIDKASTRK